MRKLGRRPVRGLRLCLRTYRVESAFADVIKSYPQLASRLSDDGKVQPLLPLGRHHGDDHR
jgi:hypothetical protein